MGVFDINCVLECLTTYISYTVMLLLLSSIQLGVQKGVLKMEVFRRLSFLHHKAWYIKITFYILLIPTTIQLEG